MCRKGVSSISGMNGAQSDNSIKKNARDAAFAAAPSEGRGNPPKAAPGIPRAVLQEPELRGQERFEFLAKSGPLIVCAFAVQQQGLGVIQSEHTHQAGGADAIVPAAHRHRKGLGCGYGDKILNPLKRTELNCDFLHKNPPNAVQTLLYRV